MKLEPMTPEEQEFAEANFWLIQDFLSYHHLSEDDFYDVVVFGYLEAVQRDFRNQPSSDKRNFPALARLCMKYKVLAFWRYKFAKKREAEMTALSLSAPLSEMNTTDQLTLQDTIPCTQEEPAATVINQDTINRCISVATKRERDVLNLVLLGYTPEEITELIGITRNTLRATLCNFRRKARAVANDTVPEKSPQQKYYEAHKAEYRARLKKWKKANRDKFNASKRAYRAAHKEEINAKTRARYWAKKNAPDVRTTGSTPPRPHKGQ